MFLDPLWSRIEGSTAYGWMQSRRAGRVTDVGETHQGLYSMYVIYGDKEEKNPTQCAACRTVAQCGCIRPQALTT